MGQLKDGQWTDEDLREIDAQGRFIRNESPWRRWVTNEPGAEFTAAPNRYHLYVNVGCPWAYRTVLYRALKGLEDVISMSCTAPGMGREGWTFLSSDLSSDRTSDAATPQSSDDFTGHAHMHQVYSAADPAFTGRVTVPVLWDRERQTIVNNESSEIIRMLNSAFDEWAGQPDVDYYPASLQAEIDAVNERIYYGLNNGVYRAGFARRQGAYEEACREVFAELDACESRLARQRYLVGDVITEADWRLFSTLLRFDLAYYPVFRCNLRRLIDYPNLWGYARDLYQQPRVAQTVNWDAFKRIYWSRTGIVPLGPTDDWDAPHGRD